jgi:outer membrane immunogenic protein
MSGSALAADTLEQQSVAHDWSGLYIGAHIGYGAVDTGGEFDRDVLVNNNLNDFDARGVLGGAQLGWNWQIDSFVFGLEGDISTVHWDSSAQDIVFTPGEVTLTIDYLATVRARAGWAMDSSLLYFTGGVAFLEGEFADTEQGGNADVSAVGGAVGGGVEWQMSQNLSVRAEGLYLFFDDSTNLSGLPTGAATDSLEIEDGFVFRLGANLRF